MPRQRYQEKHSSYQNYKGNYQRFKNTSKNSADLSKSANVSQQQQGQHRYHQYNQNTSNYPESFLTQHISQQKLQQYIQKTDKTDYKVKLLTMLMMEIDNQTNLRKLLQKKQEETLKSAQIKNQSIKEQENNLFKKKNIILNKIRHQQKNQSENQRNNQRKIYLKDIQNILIIKQRQLDLLNQQNSPVNIYKQINSIKHLVDSKRNSCLQLKDRKQEIRENIKIFRKKRFEINQQYSKEERIGDDLEANINDINEKIKIEAHFDEKLRIENLKKMEEKEAKKLHPEDLPYQDLRKLKEKNHELKLILLQVKQTYQLQKNEGKNLVHIKSLKQINNKIQKHQSYFNKHKNIQENNRRLEQQISALKQQKRKLKSNKNNHQYEKNKIQKQLEQKQEELIDFKTTVKILKKELENLESRLKYYKEIYENNKKNTTINKEAKSTKITKYLQPISPDISEKLDESTKTNERDPSQRQYEQSEQSQSICSQSLFGKQSRSKNKNNKKSKIKKQQSKNTMIHYNQDGHKNKLQQPNNGQHSKKQKQGFPTQKKMNKAAFGFTCFYLVALLIFACYYNKFRAWLKVG